tara:strand:- start:194 stop:514 length:321 start_codon:yes stop_codon:yes gene_type:complete
MSNTLGIDFSIDSGEFAEDLPSVFIWLLQSITGTKSEWSRDLDAEAEGIFNTERCEWLGKMSDFTNSLLPSNNQDVTVDGTAAHILGKREYEGVVHFELRRRVAAS